MNSKCSINNYEGRLSKPRDASIVFTARRYASAVLAMGLCLSVRLSVRHKSVFYRMDERIKLVFSI